jgi:Rhodanese-like domain
MRHFVAALAVLAMTGAASAQYKTPAAAPQAKKPGATNVPVTPNPNVQITPGPAPNEQSLAAARRITREEALKMVAAKKAVFVDVRGKSDYDQERIKGAISIPRSEFAARMQELPKDKFLITYCA